MSDVRTVLCSRIPNNKKNCEDIKKNIELNDISLNLEIACFDNEINEAKTIVEIIKENYQKDLEIGIICNNQNLSKLSLYADEAFQIRTCVHLGEVSLHDDNPLCLSVSETFKMEKLVRPGKIVFSDAASRVAMPSLLGSNYQVNAYEFNHIMTDMKEIVSEKSS